MQVLVLRYMVSALRKHFPERDPSMRILIGVSENFGYLI